MNAQEVVVSRQADWERLEQLLTHGGDKRRRLDARELLELSALYRSACGDAARVRSAGADDGTVAYLDGLLARAHNELYQAPPTRRGAFLDFIREGFPREVRRNAAFFGWASAAFYAPFFFGLLAAIFVPSFGPSVMGEAQMEMFRQMYEDSPEHGGGALPVGFYVQHNTSIAFRVFATGIFAGLGSLFMLVYQGLVIGTVFGFLIGDDKGRHLLTFTTGHAAWELTAIVIAGAAGLRMGWALVSTGGLTRGASLRNAAPQVVRLVGGAALMLSVAALIEGLWSPSMIPPPVKWTFAAIQIALVTLYLSTAGRTRPSGDRS